MNTVCLVRHGEAYPHAVDAQRPLTGRGREEARRTALALLEKKIGIEAVFHSGKTRALQTAEIVAEVLGLGEPSGCLEGLGPEDDPRRTVRWIESREPPAMLVGHLPHLGFVAALLTAGGPEKPDIVFPTAGVCCLERAGPLWRLAWTFPPSM